MSEKNYPIEEIRRILSIYRTFITQVEDFENFYRKQKEVMVKIISPSSGDELFSRLINLYKLVVICEEEMKLYIEIFAPEITILSETRKQIEGLEKAVLDNLEINLRKSEDGSSDDLLF